MTSAKKTGQKSPNTKTKATAKPPAAKSKNSSKSAARPSSSSRTKSTRQASSKSKPSSQYSNRKADNSLPKQSDNTRIEGVPLDRKLDILGIVLTLLGILTLLSMLSKTQGSLTGSWSAALRLAFGWGSWLFPLLLILVGLWLIVRNFERVPRLALGRVLGFILLFWNGLTILHFITSYSVVQSPMALAQASQGGGYAGGFVANFLIFGLGVGGAVIALAAWLLISLGLSLDISIAELFKAVSNALNRLQDWLIEILPEKRSYPGVPNSQLSSNPGIRPIPSADGHLKNLPVDIEKGSAAAISSDALPTTEPPAVQWQIPPVESILDEGDKVNYNEAVELQRARVIEETLSSFGAPGRVVEINRGPTITQFGIEPDFIESRGGRMRVRVSKISSLADDLALALSARTIRVQAPVPGKGFVGIEVPNDEVALVALRDIIQSEAFKRLKSPLRFALGLNVSGNAVAADLSSMPHLLIAGATGSGKSVCVNSLICCMLLNNTPDDLRLVMIDPKRVELTGYNGIPHLLSPVVVDLERVVTVLQWVTREMDMRYRKLAEAGCRNIQEYNQKVVGYGEKKLPFLVVIVDELADLMMLSPDETERTITRLAQLARATGIHLVIATQRPSVDVVTGLIKANFPARIAFAVASGIDSRVILDQPGAERLLGRGDMLFQAPDAPAPLRLQGAFVSESEIIRLVSYWHEFAGFASISQTAAGGVPDALQSGIPLKQIPLWEEMEAEDGDPILKEAIDLARRQGRASISMLQRRLRIGYTRAARLIETMEERGIVGPPDPGTGTREILDYGPAAPPVDEN